MINEIDSRILRELQRDGRQSNRELAERIGLSPNATGVRLKRLLEGGFIAGINARLNHPALGRPIEALVEIRLNGSPDTEELTAFFHDDPRIMEAYHVTGRMDYVIRVAAESTDDLHDLLQEIGYRRGYTDEITTSLILKRIWAQ